MAVSTEATGAPSGEPTTSRVEIMPSATDEPSPLPIWSAVPTVGATAAAVTCRGPTEGPTGASILVGPRTAGAATPETSTAAAVARAIEFTAETRSTITALALAICVGAVTELSASIWSASAWMAGEASATMCGFTIWGTIAWTWGLKGRGRRSARALGAAAGFGGGSSLIS
jgi:hypothetical protein